LYKVDASQVSQIGAGFVQVTDSSIGQPAAVSKGQSTMNVSISNSGSTQATTPAPSPTKVQSSEASERPAQAAGDSVKLSQAAQVHLYKQQGQSPSQIAANLGISAVTVDGYLGIAVAKVPAESPAAPSPEPVAAQAPAQPTAVPAK
jgi:DNA-binding CsgD family transcriptional regulator